MNTTVVFALTAPNASELGLFTPTSSEYNLVPEGLTDPDILPDRKIEIRARLYRPATLENRSYPLLIFLHGNHGTCGFFKRVQPDDPSATNPACVPLPLVPAPVRIHVDNRVDYTDTGVCPALNGVQYLEAPSYLGYDYLANRLASHGYLVVSINANRGITAGKGVVGDRGLIFARGRLVLRHLQKLSLWNSGQEATPASLGVDLRGKLDFSNVGLLGYSRGGEGVRAAYQLYRTDNRVPWPVLIPSLTIKGIFEIAPTDGEGTIDADGTAWNVLLPMCDGDVSDLSGIRPFNRMLARSRQAAGNQENPATQKSTYTVWGANHNFYNTQWQQSDSDGCVGPSALPNPLGNQPLFGKLFGSHGQRLTALSSVLAFFRANVGTAADATFNRNYNPSLFELPALVHNESNVQEQFASCYRVDRGYTPSPNSAIPISRVFEDFDKTNGFNSADDPMGVRVPNDQSGLCFLDAEGRVKHGALPRFDFAQRLAWICWDARDIPTAPVFFQTNWTPPGVGGNLTNGKTLDLRVARIESARNKANVPTDFSIQLISSVGVASRKVSLSRYTDLRGPVGSLITLNPILQTARIPLSDFGDFDLTNVRGIRFTFDQTEKGEIYVGNIRVSNSFGSGVPQSFAPTLAVPKTVMQVLPMNAASQLKVQEPLMFTGVIKSIRAISASAALLGEPGIEIEIASTNEFPVRNALVVLKIGTREFTLSHYPSGDLHTLIFTLTEAEFAQTASGEPVRVQYGHGDVSEWWDLGALDKGIIIR